MLKKQLLRGEGRGFWYSNVFQGGIFLVVCFSFNPGLIPCILKLLMVCDVLVVIKIGIRALLENAYS